MLLYNKDRRTKSKWVHYRFAIKLPGLPDGIRTRNSRLKVEVTYFCSAAKEPEISEPIKTQRAHNQIPNSKYLFITIRLEQTKGEVQMKSQAAL